MGDNPNMVDQIFSIGVLAFILAIVILMKDIIDGGTFAPSDRRSALLGFGLAGLLVLSALTMSMVSTDLVEYDYTNDDFTGYWYQAGGGSSTPTTYQSDNQMVISAHTSNSASALSIRFNLTTWDSDKIQNLRNIEFNISGIQIDSASIQADSTFVYRHTLHPHVISYTNDATNNEVYVNVTLTEVQTMLLVSSYTTSLLIDLSILSGDTSVSKTVDFNVYVENQSELANFLIWAVMSFALYIPLMIYLDAFNNIRRFVNNPLGNNRRRMRRMRR